MTYRKLFAAFGLASALAIGGSSVIGCDDKPDTAGEAVDKAGDNMKDAADKTGDAADKIGDKANDAADKVKDATN